MTFLRRLLSYRWTLSLSVPAVVAFTTRGALKALQGISNRITDWMPEDFQATQHYRRFFGRFGSDELLRKFQRPHRSHHPKRRSVVR